MFSPCIQLRLSQPQHQLQALPVKADWTFFVSLEETIIGVFMHIHICDECRLALLVDVGSRTDPSALNRSSSIERGLVCFLEYLVQRGIGSLSSLLK